MLAAVTMASGDTGRIEGTYFSSGGYYEGSDLSRLAGTWLAYENNDYWSDPPVSPTGIEVTPEGAFSRTDNHGCEIAGRFALIDTRYGLWAADYTSSGCDRAGVYSGFALGVNDSWYSIQYLYLIADDGVRAQMLELWPSTP